MEQLGNTLDDRGIEDRFFVETEMSSSTASRPALTPT